MRIASLQPSISLTLAYLERAGCLCAITRYCLAAVPQLAERNLPIVPDAWSFDRTPESARLLLDTHPDLVIGSIPFRPESLTAILKAGLSVLCLAPRTLAEIRQNTALLAQLTDAGAAAEVLNPALDSVLAHTRDACANLGNPLVYCEEWGKPLIHSQGWVAELVEAAHGRFLGTPGAHTDAQTVAAADPDVLLFAWCGAGDRVPLERVIQQRGWQHLRAVQQRRVYAIPDELLNTPSFNLIEGLRAIAAALHPDDFLPFSGLRRLASSEPAPPASGATIVSR
jgi:iron complex transport system substrate-binding protein